MGLGKKRQECGLQHYKREEMREKMDRNAKGGRKKSTEAKAKQGERKEWKEKPETMKKWEDRNGKWTQEHEKKRYGDMRRGERDKN